MKKEDFEKKSRDFRDRVNAEARKPEKDRRFPEDDWMRVDVIATCRTTGCRREGISHKLTVAEPADGVYRVLCAPCNSPVRDLDPQLEDDPEHRLKTRFDDGTPGFEGG